VNGGLSIHRLSVAAKSQYVSLCKGLQEKSFGDYSDDIRNLPNKVLDAVLGIARHIAADMTGEYCIGAVRLLKTPAQYKIRLQTEKAPFQNPTALLLEGTATLSIRVGKRGEKDFSEEVMFFGESRSGENIANTDENIVLKYVHLGNQEHEFPAANQACFWFLVNLFWLYPTTTVSPQITLLSTADETDQREYLSTLKNGHLLCLKNNIPIKEETLNHFLKLIEDKSFRKNDSEGVPVTNKLKVRVMKSTREVNEGFGEQIKQIPDFFDQDKVMCRFLVEEDQWTLCVVNFALRRFEYYDWMCTNDDKNVAESNIKSVRDYLQKLRPTADNEIAEWQVHIPVLGAHHQCRTRDYGVLMCALADCLASYLEVGTIDSSQTFIQRFRLRMSRDIRIGLVQ
jgi:hypothetical protein